MSRWKARASQLGYYMLCDYRAAFDRALKEGLLTLDPDAAAEVEEAKKSSPYADFGTCIHFTLQDGLRCKFPAEPNALYAPDPEQWENAARLEQFGGNIDACKVEALRIATMAAKVLPATPDGLPWLAEAALESKYITGHIDFLSQDFTHIVDLKTTARPPAHNRPKPEHLVQLVAYYLLVRDKHGVCPTKGTLAYVSSKGDWTLNIDVDYTTETMQEFIKQVDEYSQHLWSKNLYKAAVPRLGAHCSDGWCPYTAICKNKVIPPAGDLKGAASNAMPMVSAVI